MGGQAFARDGLLLDLGRLDQVGELDRRAGTVRVGAGIQWPALIAELRRRDSPGASPLSIVQKQTGADRMSLGGSLAANVHGRVLTRPPIAEQVESLILVDAAGELRECSRERDAELFSLVLGGYGLFGVVVEVVLRLAPRQRLRRRVELRTTEGLVAAFAERRRAGALYGDFQFAIDPESPDFLRRGVFSCYEPAREATGGDPGRALSESDWLELLYLAHTDKSRAFERYAAHYLATDGRVYDSDTHQLAPYLDDYHERLDPRLAARCPGAAVGSEVIAELDVPRAELEAFLRDLRACLRHTAADLVYGTVRLIERDRDSFLAWAREPWACTVLNLHVEHTRRGLVRARERFRAMQEVALAHGGTFFLTYQRWADASQLRRAHPRLDDFLEAQREHDPSGRFGSDWHRWLRRELERS